MITVENVSATNMRVNLTDYIADLTSEKRFAITKHGKVIAYVVSPQDPAIASVPQQDTVGEPEAAEPQPEPVNDEAETVTAKADLDREFAEFLASIKDTSTPDLDSRIAV